MRKALGVLLATSLLVPATLIATHPAGAATPIPNCKSVTGTQVYQPALPPLGNTKKVKPRVTTNLKITGCTGIAGITNGSATTITLSKTAQNCTTVLASSGTPTVTKGTIKWNNGKTSTTSNTLKQTSKPLASPLTFTLTTKYTAGVGKGRTSVTKINATLNKNACVSAPLSKGTFKSVGKIIVK